MRKELTDEWQRSGVKQGKEYAILTNEISQAWSGMTTKEYKNFKGLKKENLRDNMSDLELVPRFVIIVLPQSAVYALIYRVFRP